VLPSSQYKDDVFVLSTLFFLSAYSYTIQVVTIGSHFHTMSKSLQTRQSYATRTAKDGTTLVVISGSVSTACTGTPDVHMSLMTSITQAPLMERAVYRLFGVSAIGATVF
jgi:hypothetical protein